MQIGLVVEETQDESDTNLSGVFRPGQVLAVCQIIPVMLPLLSLSHEPLRQRGLQISSQNGAGCGFLGGLWPAQLPSPVHVHAPVASPRAFLSQDQLQSQSPPHDDTGLGSLVGVSTSGQFCESTQLHEPVFPESQTADQLGEHVAT